MKVFQYIRYFFYLAWYWNPVLAIFIIYHEIKGERKYKLHTTGYDELNNLKKQGVDIAHSTMYMPANYYILEKLMEKLKEIPGNTCLLDIGCGKGRVLIVAAHYGFKKLIGAELSDKFCNDANENIAAHKDNFTETFFDIYHANASDFLIPDEVTTFFLYNPFDAVVMQHVLEHINDSLERNPRDLYIAYMNPEEKELFLLSGFNEIFHLKTMNLLEGTILQKTHN
ncbi:MAG: class I SAM-dependent methyltransferase [Sphingobacteriales bacterium]|nr:class I SAM-dependent methyltransferase [Sphingobacteriales bacterium]MBI3718824.1 class I SAM-dependent methyltransferase [Sphingobacteriales bacterium]